MPPSAYFVVVAFALIGAGLKYIDSAFDESVFSKRLSKSVAGLVIFLWVIISAFDTISAFLLLAILLAVYLTGKVDNQVFFSGTVIVLLSLVLLHVTIPYVSYPLLFLLTLAGVVDEKLNDTSAEAPKTNIWWQIVQHRMILKVTVLAMVVFSIVPVLYFIALMAFDSSYEAMWGIERRVVATTKSA
jgi:hypothetical protein